MPAPIDGGVTAAGIGRREDGPFGLLPSLATECIFVASPRGAGAVGDGRAHRMHALALTPTHVSAGSIAARSLIAASQAAAPEGCESMARQEGVQTRFVLFALDPSRVGNQLVEVARA